MGLPTLTPAQREEALRKAQAARTVRKQLFTAIAAGEQTIPAVLERAKTDTVIALGNSSSDWNTAKIDVTRCCPSRT